MNMSQHPQTLVEKMWTPSSDESFEPKRKHARLDLTLNSKDIVSKIVEMVDGWNIERERKQNEMLRVIAMAQRIQPPKNKDFFQELNADCCLEVFRRLPMNDCISLSKTCRRLHELGENHFRRNFKTKVVKIKDIKNDQIITTPSNEPYIDTFATCIGNVTLGRKLATTPALKRLNNIYQHNEYPIKSLHFDNWPLIRRSHGATLEPLLKNVERVTISDLHIFSDLNDCLFRFMPNLQWLRLCGHFKQSSNNQWSWLDVTYPKLRYFAWHLNEEMPVSRLKRFLSLNPTIKYVSLFSSSHETVKQLTTERVMVNELHLSASLNDDYINDDLLHFDYLYLKLSGTMIETSRSRTKMMKALAPRIKGLFLNTENIDFLFKFEVTFNNLTVLGADVLPTNRVVELAAIPKLKQFFFTKKMEKHDFDRMYYMLLCRLAHNCKFLEDIFLSKTDWPIIKLPINQINYDRQRIKGAKLTIHLKSPENRISGNLSQFKHTHEKIEIIRADTEQIGMPLAGCFA